MKDVYVDARTMKGALHCVNPQEEILAPYFVLDHVLKITSNDDVAKWIEWRRTRTFELKNPRRKRKEGCGETHSVCK